MKKKTVSQQKKYYCSHCGEEMKRGVAGAENFGMFVGDTKYNEWGERKYRHFVRCPNRRVFSVLGLILVFSIVPSFLLLAFANVRLLSAAVASVFLMGILLIGGLGLYGYGLKCDYYAIGEPFTDTEVKEEVKSLKRRKRMPRIFKWSIYAALAVLIWRFVLNVDQVIAFLREVSRI